MWLEPIEPASRWLDHHICGGYAVSTMSRIRRLIGGSGGGKAPACGHVPPGAEPASRTVGCEECLATGGRWVELRLCLTCGHVGCCDNSPNRHARGHFAETGHPVIRATVPGYTFRWCWIDGVKV